MTISTIFRKTLKAILILAFWVGVWQILAGLVDLELLLPSPLAVLGVLGERITTLIFWESVLFSILRILGGFLCSVIMGVILGLLTAKFSLLRSLFSPVLHIVRAAPVASFIILALVWIETDILPAFISFLMGLPIIWQAVETATVQGDKAREEVAKVFKFSKLKTFVYVTIPAVFPSFIAAAVTTLGFCWKSGVAAEVICLPKLAIGKLLHTAKLQFETADVFAYTLVTIVLSVLLEILLKWVLRRYTRKKEGAANGN